MNKTTMSGCAVLIASTFFMTGCPSSLGHRLKPAETTSVSKNGDAVCFVVPDAKNYQPTMISIGPRGGASDKLYLRQYPKLAINNGQLCITPTFYHFPDKGQFIVTYVLDIPYENDAVRTVITGIEFTGGEVKTFRLADNETARPYSESNTQ